MSMFSLFFKRNFTERLAKFLYDFWLEVESGQKISEYDGGKAKEVSINTLEAGQHHLEEESDLLLTDCLDILQPPQQCAQQQVGLLANLGGWMGHHELGEVSGSFTEESEE